jgi:hypothetical protein
MPLSPEGSGSSLGGITKARDLAEVATLVNPPQYDEIVNYHQESPLKKFVAICYSSWITTVLSSFPILFSMHIFSVYLNLFSVILCTIFLFLRSAIAPLSYYLSMASLFRVDNLCLLPVVLVRNSLPRILVTALYDCAVLMNCVKARCDLRDILTRYLSCLSGTALTKHVF